LIIFLVFDISQYRRKRVEKYSSHELFRPENIPAVKIRQESFEEALNDCVTWLDKKSHTNVGILDGPNVSRLQREQIYRIAKQCRIRVLFIEFVCEDKSVLEANFKDILRNSDDYKDMTADYAIKDLMKKMEHYKRQYEPMMMDEKADWGHIKILDCANTGVFSHGIRTQLEQKILGYVSVPKKRNQTLFFSRHGESEFNVVGRIGGDANLSPRGWMYSTAIANYAQNLNNIEVWTSTLIRTKQTAQNIYTEKHHLHELDEIYSGECEGFTYEELLEKFPKELAMRDAEKLKYRYPQGESYLDVMERLLPVLIELESSSNILVISHQAVLRCVLGYFLGTPLDDIPYFKVPLHTVIKLTESGGKYCMEEIKMGIECVDTNRPKPCNCSVNRNPEEVLETIPSHYDTVDGLAHVYGNKSLEYNLRIQSNAVQI